MAFFIFYLPCGTFLETENHIISIFNAVSKCNERSIHEIFFHLFDDEKNVG